MNVSVVFDEFRNAGNGSDSWLWETGRRNFDQIYRLAEFIWFNVFCRIYPYNTPSFRQDVLARVSASFGVRGIRKAV